MTSEAQKALLHPFAAGLLPPPDAGAKVLFLGAEPGLRLPEGFAARPQLVQGFRPHFLVLQREGHAVAPRAEDRGYTMALVLGGRHRGRNEAWIADALDRVKPGGLVVAAAAKQHGGDSFRKRLEKLLPLDGNLSKYHGVVFWLRRPRDEEGWAALAPEPAPLVDGRFATAPGMFSHDRIDPGSRLLAENLPKDIAGAVADFGAGWGYLAAAALARPDRVRKLDLFEADHESLEAALRNLAGAASTVEIGFHWHDLAGEPVATRYDLILMNPPFHAAGRAADPGIGQAMIKAAARSLKPGGRLLMVANRRLPYERVLVEQFRDHGETRRTDAFKLLWARR